MAGDLVGIAAADRMDSEEVEIHMTIDRAHSSTMGCSAAARIDLEVADTGVDHTAYSVEVERRRYQGCCYSVGFETLVGHPDRTATEVADCNLHQMTLEADDHMPHLNCPGQNLAADLTHHNLVVVVEVIHTGSR